MNEFELKIHDTLAEGLISAEISTLQVNLGRICNLACSHCHLECSPSRSEQMPEAVMEGVLRLVEDGNFRRVEITGGSPELHPRFRYFVEALCARGHAVQVRTNLTTLSAPPRSDLIGLFKSCSVSLVGSLPCYLSENVDAWRGSGAPARIDGFDQRQLVHRRIVTGNHCFGCTAGAGSSCAGALAA